MTRAQQVHDLILAKRPKAICDKCLNREMNLRRTASTPGMVAVALATTSEFNRTLGICSFCGDHREVTCANEPDEPRSWKSCADM